MWAEGRIIQGKHGKEISKNENGLFSYIYNNFYILKGLR